MFHAEPLGSNILFVENVKSSKNYKSFADFVFRLDEILHSESHPVTRYVIEGTKSFVSDTGGNIMVDKIFKLEDTAEFTDYMAEKYNIPRKTSLT